MVTFDPIISIPTQRRTFEVILVVDEINRSDKPVGDFIQVPSCKIVYPPFRCFKNRKYCTIVPSMKKFPPWCRIPEDTEYFPIDRRTPHTELFPKALIMLDSCPGHVCVPSQVENAVGVEYKNSQASV